MPVFVVVALALAVLAVAMVVVAALQLWTTAGALRGAVRRANERLAPLGEELRDEIAVTTAELDALGARRSDEVEEIPLAYTGREG